MNIHQPPPCFANKHRYLKDKEAACVWGLCEVEYECRDTIEKRLVIHDPAKGHHTSCSALPNATAGQENAA